MMPFETSSVFETATRIVALLGGAVAFLAGVIDLRKKYRENESDLRALLGKPGAPVALGVTTFGLVLLIATAFWATRPRSTIGPIFREIPYPTAGATTQNTSKRESVIVVAAVTTVMLQMFDVISSAEHSVIASRTFAIDAPLDREATLRPAIEWAASTLPPLPPIKVFVRIPRDLSNEQIGIATRPKTHLNVSYYLIDANSKNLIPVRYGDSTVLDPGKDYNFFLSHEGYEGQTILVQQRHSAHDEMLTMRPTRINIIVRPSFPGSAKSVSFADALRSALARSQRFTVMSEKSFDELNKDKLSTSPVAQTATRELFRVDRVITVDAGDDRSASTARLRPVWPPSVGKSASGRSSAMIASSEATVNGSR